MRTIYECAIMDENLDPEQIRKVNEELGNLASKTEDVNEKFGKTKDVSTDLNKALKELQDKVSEFSKLTKNDLIPNSNKITKSQEENTKKLDENSKALDNATEEQKLAAKKQRERDAEIAKSFGYIKDAHGKYQESIDKQAKDRERVEKEIIGQVTEEVFLRKKQEAVLNEQLASMGLLVGANGTFKKTTLELNEAQKEQLRAAKDFIERDKKLKEGGPAFMSMAKGMGTFEGMLSQASSSIMDVAQKAGISAPGYVALGLSIQAVELGLGGLKKVLDASIEAQFQYTKNLLAGQRGQGLVARQNETIGKAQNALIKQLGELTTAAGGAAIALTLMMPLSIPLKLLGVGLGLAASALGIYTQYTAKAGDMSLELATQLAELRDKLFDGMNDLANASLIGSKGMTGLNEDLSKLRMGLSEVGKFAGIVKGASKELAMLGPGTVQGLNKFVDTASELINSELGDQLRYMGITNEKQAEHTLKFLAQQERLGFQQQKSLKEQGEAAGKYVIELDKLAVLTGATREEQEKARDMVMANEELRAKLLTAESDEERERIQKQIDFTTELMASGQKDMAAGAARFFASGGRIVDEFSQKFYLTMGKTGKKVLGGEGTTEENLAAAQKEGYDAYKKLAGVAAISQDAVKDLTGSGVQLIEGYLKSQKAEEAARKEGMSLPEYLKKERESRDKQTKEQADLIEKQRQAAIKEQTEAITKFGTASNIFKVGVDGFKEYVDRLKGTKEVPENLSGLAPTDKARDVVKEKQDNLQKIVDSIDAAKKEERAMTLAGASQEERKKQQDKITELEKAREKALKEEIDATNELKKAKGEAEKQQREQLKAQNQIPIIENKIISDTKKLDSLKELIIKTEKELEDAKKNDPARANAISYNAKKFKQDLEDLEKQIKDSRTLLETTKKTAGITAKEASQARKTAAATDSRRTDVPQPSSMSQQSLADMGLKIKQGDVQRSDGQLDPRLIEIAKQVQDQVPNFSYFSSFNDNFHKDSSSQHAKGKAFDFTVGKAPTKEEGQQIVSLLTNLGASKAIDEYNNPSAKATAGHFHAELAAKNGGLFIGPESGYPVTLHGKEAIIPIDKSTSVSKTELADVPGMQQSNNQNNANIDRLVAMQTELMNVLVDKLDSLDNRLSKSNDIQEDILTYSMA